MLLETMSKMPALLRSLKSVLSKVDFSARDWGVTRSGVEVGRGQANARCPKIGACADPILRTRAPAAEGEQQENKRQNPGVEG